MKLISKFLSIPISILVFFTFTLPLYAQEEPSIYSKLFEAIELDTGAYTTYYNFTNRISEDGYQFTENDMMEFRNLNSGWTSTFRKSKSIYGQYVTNPDPQIAEVATVAQESVNKALLATEYYELALQGDEDAWDRGDAAFAESVTLHDKAVDLYNNYSGATESNLVKNWLIFGSVVASIFSILLLIKSRKRSESDVEKVRSEIYKSLFVSSLWFCGGLIVTTIGYVDAYENGGSYTIFWGAIAVGGWQLLRGLSDYFTNSRQVLADINMIEKNKVLRDALNENSDMEYRGKSNYIVCKYCRSKQPKNRIICNKCGENML